VILAAVTGALLVIDDACVDDACVGLGRGYIQLQRNAVSSGLKLAFLPFATLVLSVAAGIPVLASWFTGAAVSLIVALLLNVSILGPIYLAPVLVAAVVGPEANAKFAIAQMVHQLCKYRSGPLLNRAVRSTVRRSGGFANGVSRACESVSLSRQFRLSLSSSRRT